MLTPAPDRTPRRRVLLTGATGYIGGRLAPRLQALGNEIVCTVRDPRKLADRAWASAPGVRIVQADVSDVASMVAAMEGCDAAYYLVHSMEASTSAFAERDRALARAFGEAARTAGVGRIIYLGGLGELGPGLSAHLRSRREVELILAGSGVPTTTFRAAMILGSGSASFEILRYLVERLPIMVTPQWVRTESQPIGVLDVLHYLERCLDVEETIGRTIEIGGPKAWSYRDLMHEMARQLGLMRRVIIPLPVLTPRLSSLWIGLVTPVGPAIARPLAEGLRNRVVVTDDSAQRLMPHDAMDVPEAIERALDRTRTSEIATRWSAAGVVPGDPDWAGGRVFSETRSIEIDASAEETYAAVCRVGGGHGWYAAGVLWRIRGLLDQLVGGPGLGRGRRHPERVEFGEALDFWRVVALERNRHLGLRAEMKLPGEAMLEFTIEPRGRPEDGARNDAESHEPADATGGSATAPPPGPGTPRSPARTRLVMLARFRPQGLLGLAYWYAVLPFHAFVFRGMLNGMRRAAEAMAEGRIEAPAHAAIASD